MKPSQHAYTFFEMMLVLALMAIAAAISVPSLRGFIEHHQDLILQSQLLQAIQLARQEVESMRVPVSICKSGGDWSDGLLVFVDKQRTGVVQDKQQIIAAMQFNMHGKLFWRAYPHYRDYLRFVPLQSAMADNGMFWYCRSTKDSPAFAIAMSKSGSGHVVYPDNNGDIKDSRGRMIHCLSPAFI